MEEKKDQPAVQRAAAEEKKDQPAVQRAAAEEKKDQPAVQRAAAEEKNDQPAVQRAMAEEKKDQPALQRAAAEEKKDQPAVQRAAAEEKKDEPAVQRCCSCPQEQMEHRASGTASVLCKSRDDTASGESVNRKAADMDAAAEHAISTKDAGTPLRPAVRDTLESRMGVDLGGVRVHEGAAAQDAAAAINARAFTHKGDIWLGKGESQDNTKLMAHEVTHVVQQGAAVRRAPDAPKRDEDDQPVVRRSVWDGIKGFAGAVKNAAGDLVDAAGNVIEMGVEFFWDLVKKVAPASFIDLFQEIRSKGIIGFLRDKLSGAFNGIFGGLSDGGGFIAGVIKTFGTLVSSAGDIIAALGRGDCQPLFDAVSKLGDVLKDMAGEAWDKIKEFFAPIGDFFSDLWTKFGAPVVDFLGQVASDTWEGIKALGQLIWDGTQPIRSALAAAWKWVKDQLGIGDEPEGQNGLLQWVQGKLGEAWDWIKEQLQPIIGPIKAMVEKIKSILPLDEILNLRETVHEWLQHAGDMVGNMRAKKGVTQNQASLREKILPAIKVAIGRVATRVASAGTWVAGQIGGIAQEVTGFFSSLRSNSILGKLAGAIQWVENKVNSLSEWVQSGVVSVFNTIGNGINKLSTFIEPVLNVLQKIVSVISNVVKELPGLVAGPFWKALPACIKDPIKDFIIEHILSAIPIIGTFVKIPDIWGKIQKVVMDFLTQVFVDGDLGGAALTVIRFVLEAAGINFDLMLSVLGKAASALDNIIMHPVEFLSNLLAAVKKGFDQFLDNILRHIMNGLLEWILGPLADLGVKPPKDFTLPSLLDLALQILGITSEKLHQKLEKALGPKAMKILDEAWKWIKALITGGFSGLWEEIKGRLTDLWDIVIGGITNWITVNVVKAGIQQLALLSNPVGAVLEAIKTIYTTIQFVVTKMNKILAVVDAILDSINKIAAGAIADAANWVESALARSVAPVIGFFADWIGIESPGNEIAKIVKGIQEKVDKALDWLIDKAVSIGKGLLGGKDKDEDGEDPKWKAGVAAVTKELDQMNANGLDEKAIREKFPLWQASYGFKHLDLKINGDDYTLTGSMSPDDKPIVTEHSGVHPGDKKDNPIDIQWFKPPGLSYPAIRLAPPADVKAAKKSKGLGDDDNLPLGDLTAIGSSFTASPGGSTSLAGMTIGLSHPLSKTAPGFVFQAGDPTSGDSNKNSMNRTLKTWGYNRNDNAAPPTDGDHVMEKQLGGPDDVSNVWPLNSSVNRSSGSSIKGEISRIKTQYKIGSLKDKWLRLN